MRRMRGPLQWFLLIVGIVVAGYGVRHSMEHTSSPTDESAAVTPTTSGAAPSAASRTSGAPGAKTNDTEAESDDVDGTEKATNDPHHSAKDLQDSDEDEKDDGALETRAGDTSRNERGSVGADLAVSTEKVACTSWEDPGVSPRAISISPAEWTQVMNRFHEVKEDLRNWLGRHHKMFSSDTYATMARELDNTRLQRPPSDDMPDLSWRGIGVWTRATPQAPAVIKLGAGFIHTIINQPARGKFELARLTAQSWVPCELQAYAERSRSPASVLGSLSRVLDDPWSRLTQCLGAEDQAACSPGSYSEAGWAVSSAVATMTESPGCTLPAFKAPGAAACLNAGLGGH